MNQPVWGGAPRVLALTSERTRRPLDGTRSRLDEATALDAAVEPTTAPPGAGDRRKIRWWGHPTAPLWVPLAVLALWQAVSWLAWAPPTLLPSPIQVAEVLKDGALDGSLWVNLGVSFRRVAAGYLLGAGFGLAFGAILGFSAAVDEYVGATLDAFQQVPLYGWIPLIILLVGIDEGGKIAFVALGSFTPVFVNAREGLRQVDRRHLEVAAVYGYGRWQTFWRVAAPAAAPMVMTGLRIGLGYAWMAVVGAELLGATRGVGYLITWSRMLFQSDGVLAGVVLVALVGYLLDRALAALERRISRWRDAHGRP